MTSASFETRKQGSFGWLVSDVLTIAQRDLRHWLQQPVNILITWLFPVMIALMFGGLFGGAIKVPVGSSYFEFLMPGMFTLIMLFGMESTILAVTADSTRGVIDRFRSLPISSSAVVLGRCLADILSSVIGLLILIVAGILLGWQWHRGVLPAVEAFGLLLLLRFALLWIGIFIGLNQKNPEAVSPVQILVWPVSFLSNVFVDPSTMPAWLGALAAWNPLSATAAASRQLFGNPAFSITAGTWASEQALLLAIVWPLLITIVFLPLSAKKWRKLGN